MSSVIRELLNGESRGLLKLPTDKALMEDPMFRSYVELYARVNWLKLVLIILPQHMSQINTSHMYMSRIRMHSLGIMQNHTRNYQNLALKHLLQVRR